MILPAESENIAATRFYTLGAIALLVVVVIATAASWSLYPLFIDTYYHMGVIEGFSQAGGITTRAFWEMAPGGRVHIYPFSLHTIGYLLSLVGVSPRTYITIMSAGCYFGCLLTTWIWLRRIIGSRGAFFALVLLCGPYAFFWTQAVFTAVAGVLVLAPLALLAMERRRFLICAILNFVVITMHPIGLFLPPALVINALLRRRKVVAGLLAASIPVVLYSPWLAHIWANRALLPDSRTGGDVSLGGFGVGGVNLGVFLAVLAASAIPWLIIRRNRALGLVGPLLGFAVVFPMGFGGRFFAFNIHWPLACMAGYGLAQYLSWLEKRNWLRASAGFVSVVVAVTALLAYPALEMSLPRKGGPPGGPPMGERTGEGSRSMFSDARFTLQAAALPKLFDTSSGGGGGPGGMGPPGGPGSRPNAGPSRGPGSQRAGTSAQAESGRRPSLSRGNDAKKPGPRKSAGEDRPEQKTDGNMPARTERGPQAGRGPSAGGPGGDSLRRAGADDFFAAVRANVKPGDVIYINDGAAASLLVGVTGRWTSSGILRDVRSENGRAKPEECDFMAVLSGGMGPGPGGPQTAQKPTTEFEKVFENEYGSLHRNTAQVEHARTPLEPDVGLRQLAVIMIAVLLLVAVDVLPMRLARLRVVAAAAGTIVVALCFFPLASTALGELRHPPSAPAHRGEDGLGFGGPGFGPGQFFAAAVLREADSDKSGDVSVDEFKAVAERWFQSWAADDKDQLNLDATAQGFQLLFESSPDAGGPPPPPDGLPGAGPGAFLARRFFHACDSDEDGNLSKSEMVRGFERLFRDWDKASRGSLNEEALAEGLEQLLGPPPPLGEPD
jgi:hypothetical protein